MVPLAEKRRDIIDQIDAEYETSRTRGLPRDANTGLPSDRDGNWQERIYQRAVDTAGAGEVVSLGDGDIANVSGMNAYLGHSGTDKHIKAIVKILQEEMPDVTITRRKGDELTFAKNGKSAAEMDEMSQRASERVKKYAEETIVETIEVQDKETGKVKVPKGTKMRLADIPAGKQGGLPGTGLYARFEEYKGGNVKDVAISLEEKIELAKSEVAYGRKTREAGVAAPGKQAGRIARGVAEESRSASPKTGGKPAQPESVQEYAPAQPEVNIGVNTGASKPGKAISNQEIADQIRRDLNVPLRAGHLGGEPATRIRRRRIAA